MILVRGPRFVPPTFARGFSSSSDKISWGNSFYPLGNVSGVSWSCVAWFAPGSFGTNWTIASKRSAFSTGNNQFSFGISGSGTLNVNKNASFVNFGSLSPSLVGQAVIAGINATASGATAALNDLTEFQAGDWSLATDGGSNPFIVGSDGNNDFFNGSIALVALWTPALSNTELKTLCQRRALPWEVQTPRFLWIPRHDKAAGYDLDLVTGGVGTISGTTMAKWAARVGETNRRYYIPTPAAAGGSAISKRKSRGWGRIFGRAQGAPLSQRNWFPRQQHRVRPDPTPALPPPVAPSPKLEEREWRRIWGAAPNAPLNQRRWFPPQRRRRQKAMPVLLVASAPKLEEREWRRIWGAAPNASLSQRKWFPGQQRRRCPAIIPVLAIIPSPKVEEREWRRIWGAAPNAPLAQRKWFPPQRRRRQKAVVPAPAVVPPKPRRSSRPWRRIWGAAPNAPLKQRTWFPRQRRRFVVAPAPTVTPPVPVRPKRAWNSARRRVKWFPRQRKRFVKVNPPTPGTAVLGNTMIST